MTPDEYKQALEQTYGFCDVCRALGDVITFWIPLNFHGHVSQHKVTVCHTCAKEQADT